MSDLPYFKVWGQDALGSYDLQSLSDHEYRIFWTLMCIGSVQPKRWHVPYDMGYLLRACASTKRQWLPAIDKLSRRGMVEVLNGEIILSNAPKWQETPEARRKRRQRDKERDMSRDMSRTSHADVTGHVTPHVTSTRARVQKPDLDHSLATAKELGRRKRAPTPLTDADFVHFREKYASLGDVDERIALALDHESARKYTDMRRYVDNWLRNDLGRQPNGQRENQRRRPGAVIVSDGSDWEAADRARDLLPRRIG